MEYVSTNVKHSILDQLPRSLPTLNSCRNKC